jgi:hypothetical protein
MSTFRVFRHDVADDELEWAVIERIWNELRTPYEPDERLWELTPGQRAIYALTWTRAEVSNGGFVQYFDNSTGYLLPEAIEGAEVLGAPEWVRLLEEARDALPGEYSRSRQRRQARLNALSDVQEHHLGDLDQRLYSLDDDPDTNLDRLFRRHIDAHPDEFFVDAD